MNFLISRFHVRGLMVVAVAVSLSGCIGGHATVTPRTAGNTTAEDDGAVGPSEAGNGTLPWNETPWGEGSTATTPGPGEGQPKEPSENDTVNKPPEEPDEGSDEPGLFDDDSVGASGTGALQGGVEGTVDEASGQAREPLPDGSDTMNGVNSTVKKTADDS